MDIRTVIEETPLFEQSLPSSKARILTYGRIRKFKKGQYLFHTRDQVESVYVVVSGFAVLERVNRNDNRKAIFLLGRGQLLNEVVLERPKTAVSCYALTELTVAAISVNRFLEIMANDFGFTKLVIDSMANKIKRLYHQVENTTKMMRLDKQVASRLWKFGRDFGVQNGSDIEFPFKMTITFLAELVGSNRESVSRVVKDLSAEGIITIHRGSCTIHDMEKLKKIIASA